MPLTLKFLRRYQPSRNSLLPARGRKQHLVQFLKEKNVESQFTTPRKGTETTSLSGLEPWVQTVAIHYSPQGDGNPTIHPAELFPTLLSQFTTPRKGTETQSILDRLTVQRSRNSLLPARGRKLAICGFINRHIIEVAIHYSPQGDGNHKQKIWNRKLPT